MYLMSMLLNFVYVRHVQFSIGVAFLPLHDVVTIILFLVKSLRQKISPIGRFFAAMVHRFMSMVKVKSHHDKIIGVTLSSFND